MTDDRLRGTGGNRFIGSDATRSDLMASINDQLGDLQEWADEAGRVFDLAEITISTKRSHSGAISVSVTADLQHADVSAACRCMCHKVASLAVTPHWCCPGLATRPGKS